MIAKGFIGDAHQIVEIVLLGALELAFPQVAGILEAFAEQPDGLFVLLVSQGLLGQFHAGELILGRNLSFSAFPGMEGVGIQQLLRHAILSGLVQKRNLLQQQVIPFGDKRRILLQKNQSFCVWAMEPLVQLVQFHQDAAVAFVQMESPLHRFHRFGGVALLVEPGQGKVAPDRREVSVLPGGAFPGFHRKVILAFVVKQVAQVVRRLRSVRVQLHGFPKCQDGFQPVGETAGGIRILSPFQDLRCPAHPSFRQRPGLVIMGHRADGSLGDGKVQDGYRFFP